MDEDVEQMSREQLVTEVKRLRQGIRQHRDCTGHELCWHHPALWALLPDATDPLPTVPDWPQFLQGRRRYRQSLDAQAPDAPGRRSRSGGERVAPNLLHQFTAHSAAATAAATPPRKTSSRCLSP